MSFVSNAWFMFYHCYCCVECICHHILWHNKTKMHYLTVLITFQLKNMNTLILGWFLIIKKYMKHAHGHVIFCLIMITLPILLMVTCDGLMIYSYHLALVHWHWDNYMIVAVPLKEPWRIWVSLVCNKTQQIANKDDILETLSVLLAFCGGNPPVIGGFPSQRASNTDFDVFSCYRADPRFALSQWEMPLLCNDVSLTGHKPRISPVLA